MKSDFSPQKTFTTRKSGCCFHVRACRYLIERRINAGLTFDQRLRRWPNVKAALNVRHQGVSQVGGWAWWGWHNSREAVSVGDRRYWCHFVTWNHEHNIYGWRMNTYITPKPDINQQSAMRMIWKISIKNNIIYNILGIFSRQNNKWMNGILQEWKQLMGEYVK